jgi:hypothetical protein
LAYGEGTFCFDQNTLPLFALLARSQGWAHVNYSDCGRARSNAREQLIPCRRRGMGYTLRGIVDARREEWRKSREVSLVSVLPRFLACLTSNPLKSGENMGTCPVNFIFDHIFCSSFQLFMISFILFNNVFIAM